ncbi:hypothetical protein [Salipiger sp. PrR003]|uniref:hypothetical protein n=1 Tax=Salipiger sp. PrR003 TaxID=2706776 RepID=UPI0013D98A0A|nr:hypothetical protein [Salipiger sp. PrR003]NDV53926.1 hypothetical protein [Salipiger sp. PrR003]
MNDTTLSSDAMLNMRQCIALVSMSASALRQIGSDQRSQAKALIDLREIMNLAATLGEQVLDEADLAKSGERRCGAQD